MNMDKTERREPQGGPQLIVEGYRPKTDLPKSKIHFPVGGTGLIRPKREGAPESLKSQKNGGAAKQ